MMTKTFAILAGTFCFASGSAQAQSIDFRDYWPIVAGHSWNGVAASCANPCSCASLMRWDVLAPSTLGPNAYRVGASLNDSFVLEDTGSSFILHGGYGPGFWSPTGGPIHLGQIPDGHIFQLEPTIFCQVRDWAAITSPFKASYGINPNLTDVVVWAWYDTGAIGTNPHDVVFQSGLPGGANVPNGHVTEVWWFVKNQGLHAFADVDASGGAPWPPSLDIRFVASLDCNGNGIIDRLDISNGTSLDVNLDCVPDECATGVSYCGPAVSNSTGVPGTITATGSASASANQLTLEADDLPNASFGFFLVSLTRGFVANPGGSQGNLCLGGSIGRFVGPGQVQNTGLTGSFSLLLDLTMIPQPTGFVSAAGGQVWNFQAWHRDAVSGSATSNFTDSTEVVLIL